MPRQAKQQIQWTNEKRTLTQLIPWPRNPRQIKGAQVKRLQDSFEEFGQPEQIVIGPANELYNGHQRLKSWLSEFGDIEIDVRVSSRALSEKEREKLTVYLHKGAVGEWDFDILGNEFELDELLEWGFEPFELGLDDTEAEEPTEDPGAQVDRAEELREKWDVHPGQLWQLGEHRLICGDCTDAAVVERLMGGERTDMVFTDPPYGVDYDGGLNEKKREKLAGDTSGALYGLCFSSTVPFCKSAAPWYLWFADRGGKPVYEAVSAAGYKIRAMIIWNKIDAHYGNFMAQYMQKHEPCLYCVKDSPVWNGPTNEVTVWDVKQPSVNEFHPTQKPVELAVRAITNSSNVGAIVADWFLGSGTTLIACEQLGRRCRAVEISPAYVAVALQRWADMTGQTPTLLTD